MNLRALLLAALVAAPAPLLAAPKAPAATKAPLAKAKASAAKPAPTVTTHPLIGKAAPDFTLAGLDGKRVKLSALKGKTVVLEWFNPGCPYVKKSHTIGSLIDTAKRATQRGVVWLAINSGGKGKQGHAVADNQQAAKTWSLTHAILRDLDGKVGRAYGATNTPHLFVIDAAGKVAYAGAIDNSPDAERKSPTTGDTVINYVDAALEDLAVKRAVRTPSTKPYGCSVKYAS